MRFSSLSYFKKAKKISYVQLLHWGRRMLNCLNAFSVIIYNSQIFSARNQGKIRFNSQL